MFSVFLKNNKFVIIWILFTCLIKNKHVKYFKTGENMKNKFTLIFTFVTVFAISFLTTDILNQNLLRPIIQSNETTNISLNTSYKYRISVFNGKLAVFEGESKLPYKVYDTYIKNLPEEDAKILTDGIRVNSSTELNKIIEEYTS